VCSLPIITQKIAYSCVSDLFAFRGIFCILSRHHFVRFVSGFSGKLTLLSQVFSFTITNS
jgi:hypothetical protein